MEGKNCDYLKIKELEEENQQLKEQLSNEEQSHDLSIKSFEEEMEKLRKQIKFESDARERFKHKNQQLKQSQKQLALDEFEKLKDFFLEPYKDEDMGTEWLINKDTDSIADYVLNKIEELKGEN